MVFAEFPEEPELPVSKVFDASPVIPEAVHLAEVKVRYDLSILQSLRRLIRGVSLYSHRLTATYNITAPQLVCLLTIVNEGPISSVVLSRRVFLSASTIVGILDRLEEKGLIIRQRNSKDRRVVNVQATARGEALAAQAPSPLPAALAEALKQLPELEQATIALSLERIVDLMEDKYARDASTAESELPPRDA